MTAPAVETAFDCQILVENLRRAIGIVGRAVATRQSIPVCATIAFDTYRGRVRLRATDLELGITAYCGAKVDSEGGFTVDAKLIADFVGTLPSATVRLELRGRRLHLECARRKGEFATMDIEGFPRIPEISDDEGIDLPAGFRDTVARVVLATATDDSRPVLTGACLRESELAAADGFRMALAPLDGVLIERRESLDTIIPARALREVARHEVPFRFALNPARTQAIFRAEEFELVTQLIQGAYPNYRQLIPDTTAATVTAPQQDWLGGMRTADTVAVGTLQTVRITAREGELRIFAIDDTGQESTAACECSIEFAEAGAVSIHTALASRYLRDAIEAFPKEAMVSMCYNSPTHQVVFVSDDLPGYVHVVMPVFVTWAASDA